MSFEERLEAFLTDYTNHEGSFADSIEYALVRHDCRVERDRQNAFRQFDDGGMDVCS